MCRLCPDPSAIPARLSRRDFHRGFLAASVAVPACLPRTGSGLLEPVTRLAAPVGAARTVALTLDACMGETDHRIFDTLIRLSVPATIFVTALWLRANSSALARMRDRPDLFALENHGERHLPAVLGTARVYGLPVAATLDAIKREAARGADAIEAAGCPRPRWFRGATALYSPQAISVIAAEGFAVAGFSVNADQGASLSAASVARRMADAQNGDVMIAHINQPRRSSGEGVAAGIAALRQAGVTFTRLDQTKATTNDCQPSPAPPGGA